MTVRAVRRASAARISVPRGARRAAAHQSVELRAVSVVRHASARSAGRGAARAAVPPSVDARVVHAAQVADVRRDSVMSAAPRAAVPSKLVG